MKIFAFCLAALFCAEQAYAQQHPDTKVPVQTNAPAIPQQPLTAVVPQQAAAKNQVALALLVGTTGVGVQVRVGMWHHVALRLGGNYLPAHTSGEITVNSFKGNAALKGQLGNIHLIAEYQPFKTRFFRLAGGVSYFFRADAALDATPAGGYKYGDLSLSAAQVGKINVLTNWSGIAPYAGIGLGGAFPRRNFSLSLDLGTYYLSKPKVTIAGSGMLENNKDNESIIEENMQDYRWLPVLQLGFAFKIH